MSTRADRLRLHRFQPAFEALEQRDLPSSSQFTIYTDVEPNDVITQAQPVGSIDPAHGVQVHGTIGNSPVGGADVDWFGFDVGQTEKVTLTVNGSGNLALYDNDSGAVPLGHQLILQFSAAGPATARSLDLLPGSYEVAISGAGNRYYSPVLAGSGTIGAQGPYILTIAGAAPDFDDTVPVPIVRTDIPAGGYTGSPPSVNLTLTQPLDLTQDYVTILDAYGDDLSPNVKFDSNANDLVVTPVAPLPAGQYQVVAYDSNFNQLLSVPFTVNAVAVTDTLATATPLHNITNAGLIQLPGAIGNDPYYSLFNSDPTARNPSSQVNMVSFTVSGPGQHVLTAEVFAGRIGSPLNAALTLFRVTGTNPDGSPASELVAGNDNSYNPVAGSNGKIPLYDDPVLFAPLAPGRYVLAVSATGNYADPLFGIQPGVNGVFNPNQSHSGLAGQSTGAYVLNLRVQAPTGVAPTVVQTSVPASQVFNGAPTTFTVQFSSPMNLAQLAALSGQQGGTLATPLLARFPVYVQDATGNRYPLRLTAYNTQTGVATFGALDRLTDGAYFLHLSGPDGLTDLAGDPLMGNTFSGDFVVPFTVTGSPARPANMVLTNANDSASAPTDLGVLFPTELAAGITVQRNFQGASPVPQDQADYYRFTLTADATIQLSLGGAGLTVRGRPVLLDANGNPLYPAVNPTDAVAQSVLLVLKAGTYTVIVGSWPASAAASAVYTLSIKSTGLRENPTPLASGPAPAFQLRLDSVAPPGGTPAPPSSGGVPQLNLPGQALPNVALTVDRSSTGGVLSNGAAPTGAASGLSAGPVGVVGTPGAADAVRLVLPGTELPISTTAAIVEPPVSVSSTPAGPMLATIETALRTMVFFAVDWLRIPSLTPPFLLQESDPAPAAEPTDPDEAMAAPPTTDTPPRIDAVAWAAALALIGRVSFDGSEERQRHRRPKKPMESAR